MYYGLSNFYQNHRRYVKSRDDSQLNGNIDSLKVGASSPMASRKKEKVNSYQGQNVLGHRPRKQQGKVGLNAVKT